MEKNVAYTQIEDDINHNDEMTYIDGEETELTDYGLINQRKPHSSVHAASIASSSFNLINTILGAGILTIPFSFMRVGLVPGILYQCITAFLAFYSFVALIRGCEAAKSYDYYQISRRLLGLVPGVLAAAALLAFTFAVMTSFCIILRDCMFFFTDQLSKLLLMWGIIIFVMLPMTLLKDINMLSPTSFLAIVCVVYIFCALIAFCIISEGGKLDEPIIKDSIVWAVNSFKDSNHLFSVMVALPTFALCFAGHFNGLNIYRELSNRHVSRMKRVNLITCTVIIVLNLGIGVAGYVTFTNTTKSNILVNLVDLLANPQDRHRLEIWVDLCYVAIMIVMVCSYPLLCFCFRVQLQNLIFGEVQVQYKFHIMFAVSICSCVGLIASFINDISMVLDVASAVAGIPLVLVFPGAIIFRLKGLKLREFDFKSGAQRLWHVVLRCFGGFICGTGLVLLLLGIITFIWQFFI